MGPYNIKCRWVPNNAGGMLSNSMHDNSYLGHDSSMIENDAVVKSPNVVKFETQVKILFSTWLFPHSHESNGACLHLKPFLMCYSVSGHLE